MLSAGCEVDEQAVDRWKVDLSTLKKLGEAFRMGWLHNVMARITPLTMRRREDYLIMADVFVENAEAAEHVLNRFDADLEFFCAAAHIDITEHMTPETVSDELRAHVRLYKDICSIFVKKFSIDTRDPIQTLAETAAFPEVQNDFIKDFIGQRFLR